LVLKTKPISALNLKPSQIKNHISLLGTAATGAVPKIFYKKFHIIGLRKPARLGEGRAQHLKNS